MERRLGIAFILIMAAALSGSPPAFGSPQTRHSLISFRIEGYEKFKNVRSFLDVGTTVAGTAEDPECVFLKPMPATKAATQPWSPFDFYTNVLTAEEQAVFKADGTIGEADIFFTGDNANRNGAKFTFDWTHRVTDSFRGSLDFLEKREERGAFSFLLRFTRGPISYQTLIKARTWWEAGSCRAEALGCTDSEVVDGRTQCRAGGWTRQLQEVIADASISGALSDKLYGTTDEKKKTDVAKVHLVYKEFDKGGRVLDQIWKQKVAPP